MITVTQNEYRRRCTQARISFELYDSNQNLGHNNNSVYKAIKKSLYTIDCRKIVELLTIIFCFGPRFVYLFIVHTFKYK